MHKIKKFLTGSNWTWEEYNNNKKLMYDSNKTVTSKIPTSNYKQLDVGNLSKITSSIGSPSTTLPSSKQSPFTLQKQTSLQKSPSGKFSAETFSSIANLLPKNPNSGSETSTLTNKLNSGFDTASDAVMTFNPLVGGIMKVGGFASDTLNSLTGGATTIENASNTSDKILSSKFLSLTPTSMINAFTKKSVKGTDESLQNVISGSGYGNLESMGNSDIGGVTNFVSKLFGKKDLVKARKAKVNEINTQRVNQASIVGQSNTENLASSNFMSNVFLKNNIAQMGGLNNNVLAAKNGLKLEYLPNIRKIINQRNYTKINTIFDEPIEKFENGGKVNVIPEGALHAHKHHIEGDIVDSITDKGIPVISMEDGGDVKQHAEIERNEIVFHIECSKKLEEFTKKYNDSDSENEKNDIAIEVGKMMVEEILENTDDKTGLLETI